MKLPAFILIAVCGISFAQADSLKSTIESSNKLITEAMKSKDFAKLTKELKAVVTKDFAYSEDSQPGKPQTFDQMLANMKMGIGSMKKVTVASATVLTVKEKGNSASSTAKHTMAGIVPGPDKKDHVLSYTGISTDTYVKQGGKWLMKSMSFKTTSMTMDGKPFGSAKAK
jgi:Domain of unknown function (DUF4440)